MNDLLPHDENAERWVLGSCLKSTLAAEEAVETLRIEDFYDGHHRLTFEQIAKLVETGTPVDVVLVVNAMKDAASESYQAVGGLEYFAKLASDIPTTEHVLHYAAIVKTNSLKRRLLLASAKISDLVAPGIPFDEALCRAEEILESVYAHEPESRILQAGRAAEMMLGEMREAPAEQSRGRMAGLTNFDFEIGGFFPGELIVLAARPGVGKTSLALQIAMHVAMGSHRVLFSSLEMGWRELSMRVLASRAEVDVRRLRDRTVTPEDDEALDCAVEVIRDAGLYIDDTPRQTVAHVRRQARRMKPSLVVVDYIGRVTGADTRLKRYEQVSQITDDLKSLARELDVPVLAACQLNREVEKGGKDRTPRLSHLRDSGSVEQDADMVMFIDRPELYDREDGDLNGKAELIVAKNRNGPTGSYSLAWNGATTTFETPGLKVHDPIPDEEF